MIVGTHIKDGMVIAVVPAYQLIILLDEREEGGASFLHLLTLTHLCQEPGTGDDGMRLEELK